MTNKLLGVLLIMVLILTAALLVVNLSGKRTAGSESAAIAEQHISLANKLRQERLYNQAVEEFDKALDSPAIEESKKANLAYLMAQISAEKLEDYEQALAYLIKAKFYNPSPSQLPKIEQMTVECLEKLGRSLDAQSKLAAATELASPEKKEPEKKGIVVARIGSREITMDELDEEIQNLPPFAQARLKRPEEKLVFLREFVNQELLSQAAKRQGLDKNKDVIAQVDQVRKRIMVSKYYEDEIRNKVTVSDKEVELYYQANPDEFMDRRRVKVAHIQLDNEQEAAKLLEQLKAGEDFAQLAQAKSVDERTKAKGGELGYVTAEAPFVPGIGKDEELAAKLSQLEQNELTEVIKTERGFHIFKALEVNPERKKGLEEVRKMIEAKLRREKETELRDQLMERLMGAEKVEIFEDTFESPGRQPTQPE